MRTEEKLWAVSRDLQQLEHDIDACIKGAQVNGCGINYDAGCDVCGNAAAAAAAAAANADDHSNNIT